MNMNSILQRAYDKMLSLYGENVPIEICSRFYSEKAMLEGHELYLTYLDLIGKLRERANEKGEHIRVAGPVGNLLTAHLLGAIDLDPIAECLPYEMAHPYVQKGVLRLDVSYKFFTEAKQLISEGLQEHHAVVTLCDGDMPTLTLFATLDEGEESKTISFKENHQLFRDLPHITLAPSMILDSYRDIEAVTGVKMRDAHDADDMAVLCELLSGNVSKIPYLDSPNGFVKKLIGQTRPTDFEELLKIVGLAHSTNVWTDNAEELFAAHRVTLRDIPTSPEDVFDRISEKLRARGIADTGFAYDVAQKAKRGCYKQAGGMDDETRMALLELGFDMDFTFLLEETVYLFSKAQAIAYLREAMAMAWYRCRYPEQYAEIFGGEKRSCADLNLGTLTHTD